MFCRLRFSRIPTQGTRFAHPIFVLVSSGLLESWSKLHNVPARRPHRHELRAIFQSAFLKAGSCFVVPILGVFVLRRL